MMNQQPGPVKWRHQQEGGYTIPPLSTFIFASFECSGLKGESRHCRSKSLSSVDAISNRHRHLLLFNARAAAWTTNIANLTLREASPNRVLKMKRKSSEQHARSWHIVLNTFLLYRRPNDSQSVRPLRPSVSNVWHRLAQ
jgi:hypothetical protein